jgi:hypothetical protein
MHFSRQASRRHLGSHLSYVSAAEHGPSGGDEIGMKGSAPQRLAAMTDHEGQEYPHTIFVFVSSKMPADK